MGQRLFKIDDGEQLPETKLEEDPLPPRRRTLSVGAFARTFMVNNRLKEDGQYSLDEMPSPGRSFFSVRSRESTLDQAPCGFGLQTSAQQVSAAQRPASAGSVALQYSDDSPDFRTVAKKLSGYTQPFMTGIEVGFRRPAAAGAGHFSSMESASFVDWRSEYSD
jgi:hypothetical protein